MTTPKAFGATAALACAALGLLGCGNRLTYGEAAYAVTESAASAKG